MPKLKLRTTMPHPDDPEILRLIAEAVYHGHPVARAGLLAGISERTAAEWLALGLEDLAATPGGVLSPHALFAQTVKEAEARFEAENLGIIRDARPKAWQAAAHLNERRFPDDWSLVQRVEHSGSVQIEARVVVAELPTEVRALILRAGAEALEAEHKLLPPGGTETAEPEAAERAEP